MNARQVYESWMKNTYFDEAFLAELKGIDGNAAEIEDRFYRDLEFGTAGMRGIIGAGRNRMNVYVVRKATQGFAEFLLDRIENVLKGSKEQSVAIAYDSRHFSPEFALETALVMAGNGIKAYLFEGVRTTPELSFAVRTLNCVGGIMITASHNPPEYNGYKVYDETGCQLIPELADALIERVLAVQDFEQVKRMEKQEAFDRAFVKTIDAEVDDPYIHMVKAVSLRPELLADSELKVVYTPLHGTGGYTVTRTLKEMAFSNLIPVAEQMEPDGDFPTCKQPNPESPIAFEVALTYAKKHDADLIVATDPDCDRMGLMVKDGGNYHLLTGNQIGSLFIEYVLSTRKDLTPEHFIVNTVVSSDLARAQAESFGIQLKKTLTGFKFIGAAIEADPTHFVMGYEESYGYLFDPHVRDKDAVMGTLMAIEMAEYYRTQGMSLLEVLDAVYKKHGYFVEETVSKAFAGKEGQEKIEQIMADFRKADKEAIGYADRIDFSEDETGLPKSNVLKFYMDAHSWVVLRPSGTEPKLKIYFSIREETAEAAYERLRKIKTFFLEQMEEAK
ncbi:MAG: phosphoglucomutase [Clostridiales bacterium]|jgi:phosphoglucomutase|nr:phosphoglucomutase [Clostridiales bacterium]